MTPSDLNELIRNEWRALGFYYDRDDDSREWQLSGSREGLLNFSRLLTRYADNPQNDSKSEHDHFGPHMYLKIMTWPDAGIGRNAIHGTLDDLRRLGMIVRDTIGSMEVGETARIQKQFVAAAEYAIVLNARGDDTDPSVMDPQLQNTVG